VVDSGDAELPACKIQCIHLTEPDRAVTSVPGTYVPATWDLGRYRADR